MNETQKEPLYDLAAFTEKGIPRLTEAIKRAFAKAEAEKQAWLAEHPEYVTPSEGKLPEKTTTKIYVEQSWKVNTGVYGELKQSLDRDEWGEIWWGYYCDEAFGWSLKEKDFVEFYTDKTEFGEVFRNLSKRFIADLKADGDIENAEKLERWVKNCSEAYLL